MENEGLYLLFEFLEECIEIHQKQLLSLISSLLENPNALRYFEDWNSSVSSKNSVQLLIKIYNQEDIKYGVKYDKGTIVNTIKPLNPKNENVNNSKGFNQLKKALKH